MTCTETSSPTLPAAAASRFPFLRVFPLEWMMTNQFRSVDHLPAYRGPLLQSHGKADQIVRYSLGQSLYEFANKPKQFIDIPDGTHNSPQSATFYAELGAFLDEHLAD